MADEVRGSFQRDGQYLGVHDGVADDRFSGAARRAGFEHLGGTRLLQSRQPARQGLRQFDLDALDVGLRPQRTGRVGNAGCEGRPIRFARLSGRGGGEAGLERQARAAGRRERSGDLRDSTLERRDSTCDLLLAAVGRVEREVRPATTGSEAPGSQIQTYASRGRSEVILHGLLASADPLWQQRETIPSAIHLCAQALAILLKQRHADQRRHLERHPEADGEVTPLDLAQRPPCDPGPIRELLSGPAPLPPRLQDLRAEQLRGFGCVRGVGAG